MVGDPTGHSVVYVNDYFLHKARPVIMLKKHFKLTNTDIHIPKVGDGALDVPIKHNVYCAVTNRAVEGASPYSLIFHDNKK